MKRFVTTLGLALIVVLVLPGVAGAWKVKNNAGKAVGTVEAGRNDYGATVGLIRTASASEPIANVLRVIQDEFDGWLLINGTSDEDWVAGILRGGSGRFTAGRVDGSHRVLRATKASSGRYWILSRRVKGSWHRIGSVSGGTCKGAWAAGAGRKLLW